MSDVAQFLDDFGLARYARAFAENAIEVDLLVWLKDEDLRNSGLVRSAIENAFSPPRRPSVRIGTRSARN